jgi:1-acyl-sn-glycerol-3-phosphate acyltransferase
VRPNPLPLSARIRSNVLLAPPFVLAMAFFGCLSLAASTFDKHGRLQQHVARIWARVSVFFSGSRLKVIGLENIPAELLVSHHKHKIDSAEGDRLDGQSRPHGQCVFAGNHTSYMDTPVVFASLPFQFRILAKKELWTLPFIGWYLSRSGQLPIDTANPRATLSSLGGAVRTLRDGLSVYVFPEGSRTPHGDLQDFLNGAAYIAIRAQVPLVPVALIGVYDLLPIHTTEFYNSGKPLKFVFGKPIPTKGHHIREADALTTQLRDAISALISAHSA